MNERNVEAFPATMLQWNSTYSDCVFVPSMQYACPTLSSVTCPALQNFHVISQKARFSGGGT